MIFFWPTVTRGKQAPGRLTEPNQKLLAATPLSSNPEGILYTVGPGHTTVKRESHQSRKENVLPWPPGLSTLKSNVRRMFTGSRTSITKMSRVGDPGLILIATIQ